MKSKISLIFISVALFSLLGGVVFGVVGAMQFVYPGFLKSIPFFKVRPLHVSLIVSWIFFSAVGGIYYYLPKYTGLKWKWNKGPLVHLVLYLITGVAIIGCYIAGKFGGREYWEFPPLLAIPIVISWLVFGLNYFQTVFSKKGKWPVYLWMWATGIFFFLFTFIESYLWVIPYFRDNIVRDMTIQWKSYGALTGSWNMLVYGTAIFVMERISGNEKLAYSRITFLMYFLGLANLMFGWSHHIYTLPVAQWVRYLGYAVSMTELIILARIIWQWKESLASAKNGMSFIPSRFMVAADVWIFLNLFVAILISIPAINLYTHGTHVTVAHAMGSTIGINTMILLSSCFYILWDLDGRPAINKLWQARGFWLIQVCLFIFWIALIAAGIQKGILTIRDKLSFQQIMQQITVYLKIFAFAGLGIFTGLTIVLFPLLKGFLTEILKSKKKIVSLIPPTIESKQIAGAIEKNSIT
jgi:nitric oxide reductase subunit B